jgi:hypothetical protein
MFTAINFEVCQYCTQIRAKAHWYDGYYHYCVKDGSNKPILLDGTELALKGCEKFEAGERPIHPTVYGNLIQINPLIKNVKVDETYTDTSWAFTEGKYPTKPYRENE